MSLHDEQEPQIIQVTKWCRHEGSVRPWPEHDGATTPAPACYQAFTTVSFPLLNSLVPQRMTWSCFTAEGRTPWRPAQTRAPSPGGAAVSRQASCGRGHRPAAKPRRRRRSSPRCSACWRSADIRGRRALLAGTPRSGTFSSFVPGVGSAPAPPVVRCADGETAGLARALHDATRGNPLTGRHPVVCHHYLDPNNTVFQAGAPIAFIDFDQAPGSPLEDVGYMAWLWCVSSKV